MFKSWRLGKLFDIPVYVHPTFLLLPLLVLLQSPGGLVPSLFVLSLVAAIFGCVLLHEFGHALAARAYGIGTRDITLYPIGGVARLDRMSEKPSEELVIALAGPAVNVAIAALLAPFLFLFALTGALSASATGLLALVGQFLLGLCVSNVVLVLFNLVPAFPMDGGRVLRALLSMGLGQLRATEIAAKVGFVMAVLLALAALYFGNPMLLVVAVFVIFAGQQELLALRHRARMQQPTPVPEPGFVYGDFAQPTPEGQQTGFSGLAYDREAHVWVQWLNGRPVAYWGQAR
jgi:Zn-dependent protease